MFPLRDDNPRHGPALVTWALVAIALAVFWLEWRQPGPAALAGLLTRHGFVPREFFRAPLAEAPTLLTSLFLHGSLAHIAGNLFFLWVFGDNVEDRMGHGRFLAFYALGGAVATLAHGLVAPASPVPMIGASGAISALLGAYIVLFPHRRVLTFLPPLLLPWLLLRLLLGPLPRFFLLWLPAWVYIGYWALIQVVEATDEVLVPQAASGVAWWAHVGGFLFGLLVVRRFVRRDGPPAG